MNVFLYIPLIITLVMLSYTASAQTGIKIDSRLMTLCQHSAADHAPNANAEYQPGVDVDGNAVTPADIGVTLGTSIYPLRIPLEMDLLQHFNLDVPYGIITDADVAGVMVHEDGFITYNGHDISSKVETFCIENRIVATPSNYERPQVESKTTTATDDKQVKTEPLAPPQEHEIIKGEYH